MPLRRPLLAAALLLAAAAPLAAQTSGARPAGAPTAAPAAAPSTSADSAAVVALFTRLFDAMRARDTAAMRSGFAPTATLASSSVRDGVPTVSYTPIDAFLASVGRAPAGLLLDERLYNMRVDVADGLASVWVEYDFYAGPRFSHCGVDAAHVARTAEGWKIVALADTRRTAGCPTR